MGWAVTVFILGLIRFISLALSFALATLAAALFITFVLFLGSDLGWIEDDPITAFSSAGFATASWLAIAQMTFIPFLIVIPFLEFTRATGFTINLIAGGAIALVAIVMSPLGAGEEIALPYPSSEIWIAFLSAGFVSGFVYWILSGHRAGKWLGTPKNSLQE